MGPPPEPGIRLRRVSIVQPHGTGIACIVQTRPLPDILLPRLHTATGSLVPRVPSVSPIRVSPRMPGTGGPFQILPSRTGRSPTQCESAERLAWSMHRLVLLTTTNLLLNSIDTGAARSSTRGEYFLASCLSYIHGRDVPSWCTVALINRLHVLYWLIF